MLLFAVTVTPPHREGSEGGALQPATGYVTRFMPTCRRPLRPKHIGTTVAGSLSIGKYRMSASGKRKKNDRPQSLSFNHHTHAPIQCTLRRVGDSNPRYSYPYGSLANYWFQPLTQLSGPLI